MDYQAFLEQLPSLYLQWGQETVVPKEETFQAILNTLPGETSCNILQLLNCAVGYLAPTEVYCEVGPVQGITLVGALLNHPDCIAWTIGDFGTTDDPEIAFEELVNQLEEFGLADQVLLHNQTIESFFYELRSLAITEKIGIYYYRGLLDYRSQLLSLALAKEFLADQALIIVDNSNREDVEQAIIDFILLNPECRNLLNLKTRSDRHSSFYNGIHLLSWDSQNKQEYEFEEIERQQQKYFLEYFKTANIQFIEKNDQLKQLLREAASLHYAGRWVEAIQKYLTYLQENEFDAEAWHDLGMTFFKLGNYTDALRAVYTSLNLDDTSGLRYYSLGLILQNDDKKSDAISAYYKAIEYDPILIDAYNNLGNLLMNQGDLVTAEQIYRQAINLQPDHFGTYLNLGNVLLHLNKVEDAVSVYQIALRYQPDHPDILINLLIGLKAVGQPEVVIETAQGASEKFPDLLIFKFFIWFTLPIIYESTLEVDLWRNRFTQALEEFAETIRLDTPEDNHKWVAILDYGTTFFLQYQGKNDRHLQRLYGESVHRIMAANYPQWVQPLPMYPLSNSGRLRVGYVSHCLKSHTVDFLFSGWVKYADRERFEIYCYHLDTVQDHRTEKYRLYSHAFHHIPNNLEAVCQQIINDRLHILVFLDLGMYALPTQIAALRLAPIQCLTWGHPITSGLPTIDYFLTSDLMEPEDGEKHYTEQLVRLPNISIAYEKPIIPEVENPRTEFGLAAQDIVYLSCQSLFKYLPQYDFIFPAIAQQVKQARLVFISYYSQYVTNKFRKRLHQAFKEFGLNYEEFCIFSPPLKHSAYLRLNLAADIFLDTLSWSGGRTTLEAIACGLPVVTCPGEFMRGRHAYGILRQMGVTATIAHSESEYIEIAVRLGQDPAWRAEIGQQMQAGQAQLYEDITSVRALEDFYWQVTGLSSKPQA
ncbi:O-linked N-acetylglucosamine transferase, SPINDLY family protein [Trichothermofontia sp.]